jgi:hypothetical protein
MNETSHSDLQVQYNWTIQLKDLEDVFFYVTWYDCRKNNIDLRPWYEITIEIARRMGPRFMFSNRYGTGLHILATEDASIEFIRKALAECQKASYEMIISSTGSQGIRCKVCGRASYHQMDVKYLWCSKCETFHYEFVKI